jgi:putative ABC transport system permease protein
VSLARSIGGVVRAIDPAQPIGGVRLLSDQVDVVMGSDRFSAALVSVLGGIGVLLAAFGLYGAIAYSVSQRRGEFAVRVALGATPADLRQLVLGQAGWLLIAGLVIGLAVARGLASAIGAVLYDVRPGDPLTFTGVAAILALVGFVASYVPARRAAGIDPAVGLRSE